MAPTFFSAGVPHSLPTYISLAPPAQDTFPFHFPQKVTLLFQVFILYPFLDTAL